MKGISLPFSLFFFCLLKGLSSQPVVNLENFPGIGSRVSYLMGHQPEKSGGESGAGITWDFSRMTLEPASEIRYMNPEEATFADRFPQSNLAFGAVNLVGDYTFLRADADRVDYLGFEADVIRGNYIAYYNDPWTLYSLPLNYGNTFYDTYACSSTKLEDDKTIDYFFYGTYSYRVDGYGTIVTPNRSIPNTLRINAEILSTDSEVVRGKEDTSIVVKHKTNKVIWVTSEKGNAFEVASTFDFRDFFFAEVETPDNAAALEPPGKLYIFPDPATTSVRLDIGRTGTGQAKISISNVFGDLMRVRETDLSQLNGNGFELAVSTLPAGIYFIRVKSNDQVWEGKFVRP